MSDIEKRRAILFEVLAPVLSEQELDTALDIWAREFSSQTVLVPSIYLSSIAESLDIANKKDKILNVLMRNVLPINLMGTQITKVNQPKTRGNGEQRSKYKAVSENQTNPAIKDADDPKKVVFSALLEHIIGQLNYQNLSLNDLKLYLLDNLRDLKLPTKTKAILLDFSKTIGTDGSITPIDSPLNIADMSGFLDLVYSWSCDFAGPVASDKLFSKAIQMTDSLPEAREFPPKKLF